MSKVSSKNGPLYIELRTQKTCLYKLITSDTDGDISVRGLKLENFPIRFTYVVKSKLENYRVHLGPDLFLLY